MRCVILRKADAYTEAYTEAALDADETLPFDTSLPGAALLPSAHGVRLHFSTKDPRVVPGPFAHTEDLVAAFGYIEADSLQAATEQLGAGRPSVVDGPFAEAKELIAGFWLIRAPSIDEAIEWASRYPYAPAHPVVEIRPVREAAR